LSWELSRKYVCLILMLQEKADVSRLRELVTILLDEVHSPHSLRPEVSEVGSILRAACNFEMHEQIDEGESMTGDGLAVSPTMAARCLDEYMRTILYLRGLMAAIREREKTGLGRSVRVRYAGCGPLGTLAVPLMSVLKEASVEFVFLDIHEESIESARSLVQRLGLEGFVSEFVVEDAMNYEMNRDKLPDVIVMETMTAILEREMQVPMTRWLLSQCPDATLVPKEIRIDLILTDSTREFDLDNSGRERKRMEPLEVFVLNKESQEKWKNLEGRLPGGEIVVPQFEEKMEAMLFTTIKTFGDHQLRDYDCGLTSPRYWAEPLVAGERWSFSYQLKGVPQLIWEKM